MKTKHKFYLLALLLSLQSLSIVAWAVTITPVDSMFQVIKGSWYLTKSCTGITGKCDSVYSSTRNAISKVLGNDSLYWKTYENGTLVSTQVCMLSKKQSLIKNKLVWFLTIKSGQLLIPYLINSDGSNLSLSMDAYDGGAQGYSRVMNETPSQARIDSVAQCLAGDWYKVYNCMGFTGFCDSVYSEMKYNFTPIAGTDSIIYTGTTMNPNQVGAFYVKYRIIETAINTINRKSWMLVDENGGRMFVTCGNGLHSLQIEGADTSYDLFSRNPRISTPQSLEIDSVAACLIGSWYKVGEIYPMGGPSKPFYSKNKNEFKHSTGSSTINWVKYDDHVLISDVQYKLELNADSLASGFKWKLIREWPMPDCVNLNNDFLFNCQSDTLKILNYNIDLTTTTSIYTRNIRINPNRQAIIDSIASLLVGDWYEYQVCHGISDVCDSVYSSLKYTFTHKPGTDSLIWTGDSHQPNTYIYTAYKLVEDEDINGNLNWSLITQSNNEIVDNIFVLPHSVNYYYRFDYSAEYFGIQNLLPQSRYTTYARSPRAITPSLMKIDSVANCLEGEWYLKSEGNASYNQYQSKKIIITHEDGVAGILATCYMDDSISGYWDYGVEIQANNPNQVNLHFAIYPTPTCGMTVLGFIDTRYIVECNDSTFKITELNYPANYQIYTREKPNNGTKLNESTANELGFSISPNPVKTGLRIQGEKKVETIKILSLNGNTLREEIGDVRTISMSAYNKGIYFLQISSEGKMQTVKLIKE